MIARYKDFDSSWWYQLIQKKPKSLEIVQFGFDTDGLSGLVVFWFFF